MNKYILTVLICFTTLAVNAQFLGGFFSQKKENRKRLAEQIALLQVYKGYLQKGYNIARTGLTTISQIKNGDFSLHKTFFSSLKTVNPKIKKYSKVFELLSLTAKSISYQKLVRNMASSEYFTAEENLYINRVLERILSGVATTVDELLTIITDNQLELKDDERLNRIDGLYLIAQDQYSFIRNFTVDVGLQERSKIKEQHDLQEIRILNNMEQIKTP